jgi:predicted enzyme related to lactoylglutathione lyase
MTNNAIVHFDICGPHEAAVHTFYRDLLGWTVDPQGPGYALVETPSGLRGSIVDTETPQLTIGVAVADLDTAVAEAQRLGGAVVMPPTDNGWVVKAQVRDPAGNVLTLIQQEGPTRRSLPTARRGPTTPGRPPRPGG